jgi:hypothetical protein
MSYCRVIKKPLYSEYNCDLNISEVASSSSSSSSSSDSDLLHYIIIKLYSVFNIQWEAKSPCGRLYWYFLS